MRDQKNKSESEKNYTTKIKKEKHDQQNNAVGMQQSFRDQKKLNQDQKKLHGISNSRSSTVAAVQVVVVVVVLSSSSSSSSSSSTWTLKRLPFSGCDQF